MGLPDGASTMSFHVRELLNHGDIGQLFGNFVQVFARQLRVRNFAAAETHAHFHFHAIFQPLPRITHFEAAMVRVGLGSQLDFLDLDDLLGLLGFTFLFVLLIQELAEVHDLHDGRLGLR